MGHSRYRLSIHPSLANEEKGSGGPGGHGGPGGPGGSMNIVARAWGEAGRLEGFFFFFPPWRSRSGQKRDIKRGKPSETPVVNRKLGSWDGNGSRVEKIREPVRP